jgi:hypothetical protein
MVRVTVIICFCVAVAWLAVVASASAVSVSLPPYGEVARFGGFDSGATYSTTGSSATSGLSGVGQTAQLVYPVSMAVDAEDPNAPDKYAIYVLENVNPQALDGGKDAAAPTNLSLEYRIQKIGDEGKVLAQTLPFTLKSSATEPGLHAASLAVNGQADRVYVMLMDVPAVAENSGQHGAVVAIDAWTTGREGNALTPAVGIKSGIDDELKADSRTGGGELIGPAALQSVGGHEFTGDIDGASIAVYGHGATADLALGGNRYSSATTTSPTIDLIKTAGAQKGQIDGSPWSNVAGTENSLAKNAEHASQFLYSLSANEDESLNVSLGGAEHYYYVNLEPNMATVGGGGLSSTTALLPSPEVAENLVQPEPHTNGLFNVDASMTMSFSQDIDLNGAGKFMPSGGTVSAGTLAPSVVQLDGGLSFPHALYAGVVAHEPGEPIDKQNPHPSGANPETSPTWKTVQAEVNGANERKILSPASLGVHVFNVAGESLAMIGNETAGGPCNLQSSPDPGGFGFGGNAGTGSPSFVAVAPGREGVLFVLVQPDLINVEAAGELVAPDHAVGAGEGDQIVEFAPGAMSAGAGANASKWRECPQPEGNFSVTNETLKEPANMGSGEVDVRAGTKLKFNAEEATGAKGEYLGGVKLRGGSPWAYDWKLEGGQNNGVGPLFEFPWTVQNTFTEVPENKKAYVWPNPFVEAEFKTPGVYTETLNLVNDFGTLTTQRTVRVLPPTPPTEPKISPSASPTEGVPVLLKASATLPADDKVKDYHWEFGDGRGEDTGEHAEVEHTYEKAGSYTVKLTVTDVLGQKAEVEEAVAVAKAAVKEPEKTKTTTTTTSTTTSTTSTKTVVGKKTPTKAQKLAAALKVCKKVKSKKKRTHCEAQARAKYGSQPGKSKKKKSKKGGKKK